MGCGVSTLGGGTMAGTVGTMAGLGASAFGASALQMLTRSSMHLDLDAPLAHQHALCGISDSIALAHTSIAHTSIAHTNPLLAASLAQPPNGVMSSEVRTRQLAAGLYSQMDLFYTQHAAHGYGAASADGREMTRESGLHPARLPPLVGTDQGDYELAPVPPDESAAALRDAPPPPRGYAPLPNPPA